CTIRGIDRSRNVDMTKAISAGIDRDEFQADVFRMFNSTIPKSLKVAVAAGFISALAFSPLALAAEQGKENLDASASKEITGEVVDMMCYVDHNAMGDKHTGCAAKCIKEIGRASCRERG